MPSIKFPDGHVSVFDNRILHIIRDLRQQVNLLTNSLSSETDTQLNEHRVEYVEAECQNAHYFVPKYALHRVACREILSGRVYEPDTHHFVEAFCAKFEGSMVHAGTFFGDMLPNFSKFVQGTVYAFEPVLENFILAKLCVERNQLRNVVLQNAALGSTCGTCLIRTQESPSLHCGGSAKVSEEGVITSMLKLDSIDDPSIVILQLDVEGHELEALKGAQKLIQSCRPVIMIEDFTVTCNDFLQNLGYVSMTVLPELRVFAPIENQLYQMEIRAIVDAANP